MLEKTQKSVSIVILVITFTLITIWGIYLLYAYYTSPKKWPFEITYPTPDPDSGLVAPPNAKNFSEPLTETGQATKKKLIQDALDKINNNVPVNNPYNKI